MVPGLDAAHAEERRAHRRRSSAASRRCDVAAVLGRACSSRSRAGQRETQVERARIEQLENQQRHLLQQQERQESGALGARATAAAGGAWRRWRSSAELARDAGQKAAAELAGVAGARSSRRARSGARADAGAQCACARAGRRRWARRCRPRRCSRRRSAKCPGKITQWLKSQSLDRQPRVAQQLRVDRGWERAVETVLGSYLEAVCVDGLDSVTDLLASFDGGHLAVVSMGASASDGRRDAASLQAKVQGAAVLGLGAVLGVHRRDAWTRRCKLRRGLSAGRIGGHARRHLAGRRLAAPVARPGSAHRRDRARGDAARAPRAGRAGSRTEVKDLERRLELTRERVREHEDRRERLSNRRQPAASRACRPARRARFGRRRARADAARRLSQLETGLADVRAELARTETDLRAARGRMEAAIDALAALEPQRMELEQERDRMRAELARRARRRRRRNSARASWRCRWSRGARRTPP